MLRQDPNRIGPDRRRANLNQTGGFSTRPPQGDSTRMGGVDIQRELNKLEEMILDSPRIPLSRRTVVDEEQLLDQLDLVRLNLPTAFQEATDIVLHKEEVIGEAEHIAQQIIANAEQRALQILNEMDLVRQAEREAHQIRQQVQQECELMQQQVLADIDQARRRAQQELEEMQRIALAECAEIQRGADDYADRVLSELEAQFTDMMRVVRNGRQQIQVDSAAKAAENANLARRLQERLM
jgi:hypothetical protein